MAVSELGFGAASWYQAQLNWTELQEWKKKKKNRSVLPSLANLFHIWHDIKLSPSLFIFSSLSWVRVSMMSTYWLFFYFDGVPERSWLTTATYGKHRDRASRRFFFTLGKRMNVGRSHWFKQTNTCMGRVQQMNIPTMLLQYIKSFRFFFFCLFFLQRY